MHAAISGANAAIPIRELEAQLTELLGHCNAAEHRWLTLLAEFDQRKGWSDGATHSCAHWLNWKCGLDMGTARERLRVAHALLRLPKISSAMAAGQLSYSKVRAITRVACQATEQILLDMALHGTAHHVETLVRTYRRAKEAEELSREARQHAERRLSLLQDYDGSWVVRGRLPAETGVLLMRALDAAVEEMPPIDVSAETSSSRPSLSVRRADAISVLAESFLARGADALNGGERHQIVLHVDAETLKDSVAGRCEFDDGPAMAAETARRLACDSSVMHLLEDENGEPLNVGRKSRSIPPAIRRALNARDRGCRFPGCTHQRYVDAHHIRHWAHGGETRMENLVILCRFHHRAVHEGGLSIERLESGTLRFKRPDGYVWEIVIPDEARPAGDWKHLASLNEAQGTAIGATTATTRWRGELMDYGTAIDAMLYRRRRATTVTTT
jgi:hypothetical protein